MPTIGCTSPGKAEGGTGKPPKKNKKKTEGETPTKPQPRTRRPTGKKENRGGQRHNREAVHPVHKWPATSPGQATPKATPTGPPDRTRGDHPAQPGDAQPKASPHHDHMAAEGPEERTLRTRGRTPHRISCVLPATQTRRKKRRGKTQTKGGTGAETKGPKTDTGDGDHHTARTRQGREPHPKRTHHEPQRGMAGRSRNPGQNTHTQDPGQKWRGHRPPENQTEAAHNSRKPSVHSAGTEAAPAMQVTRPNEIWRPGVKLHPKACAAFGLEAELATPKHLGTPVPRTCMHALGTGIRQEVW